MSVKVGDKVRIIGEGKDGERIRHWFAIGTECEVTSVPGYPTHNYELTGKLNSSIRIQYVHPLDFEPVNVGFKIGDRVKRVKYSNSDMMDVGECGTVVAIHTDEPMVIVDTDRGVRNLSSFISCLELVDEPAAVIPIIPMNPTGLEQALKDAHPYGHPEFIPDMLEVMELHSKKNHDYASGGDPLGNFDRVAAIKQLYPGFPWDSAFGVAWGNMLKQFDAVMWGMAKGIVHCVEGLDDRLRDIIVYSAIGRIILRRQK